MWKICSSTTPTKTLRIQLFWKLGISYIDNIFWNLSETFFYNGTILLHIASLDSWVHEMSCQGALRKVECEFWWDWKFRIFWSDIPKSRNLFFPESEWSQNADFKGCRSIAAWSHLTWNILSSPALSAFNCLGVFSLQCYILSLLTVSGVWNPKQSFKLGLHSCVSLAK